MAGSTDHRNHKALRAQINVTPLVDVVLVLLIIFLVVTPLLTRGKDVQLPAAKTARQPSAAEVVVLSVTPDRQLWLETRAIREAELEVELAARAGRGRELLLKADSQLSMRELRPLLRRLRAAGFPPPFPYSP